MANVKLTKTQQEVLDEIIAKRDAAIDAGGYENYYTDNGKTTFAEFIEKKLVNDRKYFGGKETFESMSNYFIDKYEALCAGKGIYTTFVNTRTLEALEKKGYIEIVRTNGTVDVVNLL